MKRATRHVPLFVTALATTCGAAATQASTIAKFDFDQLQPTSPKSYKDISGNNHNAVANFLPASIGKSSDDPFNLSQSKSVTINGKYAQLSLNNPNSIDLKTNGTGSQFTVEGWFKLDSNRTGKHESQIKLGGSQGGTARIRIGTDETGHVSARIYHQGGASYTSTQTILDGKWHHLALAYLGAGSNVYLDGNVIGNTYIGKSIPSEFDNVQILTPGSNHGNVKFDDVRISDVALSASELGYNGSFTVVPEPASLAMLSAGGLLFITRRRRAASSA